MQTLDETLKKIQKGEISCICELPEEFPYSLSEIYELTGKDLEGHWNQAGGYCCRHYGNTCGYHPEYDE